MNFRHFKIGDTVFIVNQSIKINDMGITFNIRTHNTSIIFTKSGVISSILNNFFLKKNHKTTIFEINYEFYLKQDIILK